MRNKREFKRFDLIEIQGKMTMANKVEIVDISLGGLAIKADRKLDLNREYVIKLGDKGDSIDVRCVVVRSTLVGMEQNADGESVLIYAAGMKFKEGQEDKIKSFLKTVPLRAKEDASPVAERRLDVRFSITAPQEKLLCFPANFKVMDISLSSMLIHSDQFLEKGSQVPMGLYLNDDSHLDFIGKVFSCRKTQETGKDYHEIEVTFSDLTDTEKTTLKTFIDYLVTHPEAGR